MALVFVASRASYAAHLDPLRAALAPAPARTGPADVAVVASYTDLRTARRDGFRRFARLEHGSGQSYGGDSVSATDPSYAGGRDHADVELFLVPNDHAADRWQAAYPRARVVIVGCPALGALPTRQPAFPDALPVVALGFHWDCPVTAEAGSAIADVEPFLAALGARRDLWVIGHGHPRRPDLARRYAAAGIEFVPTWHDVVRRADLYVADNTSTLFEFAWTGRPVVVLNSRRYRRQVNHGLRFWSAADVGLAVDDPPSLSATIDAALIDPADLRRARARAVDEVYALGGGSLGLAIDALDALTA